jgi:hypothetical protein
MRSLHTIEKEVAYTIVKRLERIRRRAAISTAG